LLENTFFYYRMAYDASPTDFEKSDFFSLTFLLKKVFNQICCC
jgi:hypothetical protein